MKTLFTTAALLAFSASAAPAAECTDITADEVKAAQDAWGKGIVAIGAADEPKAAATAHLDTLYGYDMGTVLFKPTKAAEEQFRGSKEEALSYFVTGEVEEDKGFALAPYTKVRFENEGIISDCDSALAMGNYFFTPIEGDPVKVEYSFGYVKDDAGNLRINLHHSSLPYQP